MNALAAIGSAGRDPRSPTARESSLTAEHTPQHLRPSHGQRHCVRDGGLHDPVRRGGHAQSGHGSRRAWRPARAGADGPGVEGAPAGADRARLAPAGATHVRGVRPRAGGAERPVRPRCRGVRARRHVRRVRGRGRRVHDRHRKGRESLYLPPTRRFPRLRQCADRKGTPDPRTAETADGDPDHCRDRERNDGRRHLRSAPDASQDRHRQSPAQADARLSGSREHPHHAAASRGVDRPIRGRTRSAMCGRCRRSAWWRSISSARWRIRQTTKRAST